MSARPGVSVVVPFAGDRDAAMAALELLRSLDLGVADERILVDNCGVLEPDQLDIIVVRAGLERSPAHARNVGAHRATQPWILFLDADVLAPADLLEQFFAAPIGQRVGALTGDIVGVVGCPTLAARYGASRNFLDPRPHLAHPYRPRAAAANLLVRREAFLELGGFAEGVRAAEDTDFCWRLQEAGWGLGFCPGARVGHRYRDSLGDLRRQWRAYAAGARWLQTRWPGYQPDSALGHLRRVLVGRLTGRPTEPLLRGGGATGCDAARDGRRERAAFLLIQLVLACEEQVGLRRSNALES